MMKSNTLQYDYTIKLPAFEGPLDLLLHLIREHKLDIYDIPIVDVTDQYLKYLSLMESLDLNIAGDFFVVAASLLEIKSKMLLPIIPKDDETEEGEDPRSELVEKLLEYERFKELSSHLQKMEEDRRKMFWRASNDLDDYDAPKIIDELTAMDLLFALQKMLDESEYTGEITSIEKQKVSLRIKMREIWNKIKASEQSGINFVDLFKDSIITRTEIVITFLSILELLKNGKIKIKQRKPLGEIMIWAVIDG